VPNRYWRCCLVSETAAPRDEDREFSAAAAPDFALVPSTLAVAPNLLSCASISSLKDPLSSPPSPPLSVFCWLHTVSFSACCCVLKSKVAKQNEPPLVSLQHVAKEGGGGGSTLFLTLFIQALDCTAHTLAGTCAPSALIIGGAHWSKEAALAPVACAQPCPISEGDVETCCRHAARGQASREGVA
jgi:hypothetical protein